MSTSETTCSNGLVGIENGESTVCCDSGCGLCGGPGCGEIAGLSVDDCCVDSIEENGQICSDTNSAPCVLDAPVTSSEATCSNGVAGVESLDNTVCCDSRCEVCGGAGCGDTPGLSGEDCCTADIESNNELCSDIKTAPCVMDDDPVTISPDTTTCSNGVEGVEDGESIVCCNPGCEVCGGSECGATPGLSTADCCVGSILSDGQLCSVTQTAPCVFDVVEEMEQSTCSNGLAGYEDSGGKVCCAESCGQCGGPGCGSIEGTNGDTDCCSSTILLSGVNCGDGVEAPCIIGNSTSTNVPTASPSANTVAPGVTLAPGATHAPGVTLAPESTLAPGATFAPGFTLAPGSTLAPTSPSRGGMFSAAPTEFGHTRAPSSGSRGGIGTSSPSPATASMTPTVIPLPINGASTAFAGSVVTLAAMVGGMFAMFMSARK